MGSRIEVAPGTELGAAFAQATLDLDVTGTTIVITRKDGVFELMLLARGPRSADQNRNSEGTVTVRGLDASQIGVAVAWARRELAHTGSIEIRPHIEWPFGSSLEARATSLRTLVPGATPTKIEICRGVPMTERGEDPRGQASVRVTLTHPDRTTTFCYLDFAMTDASDHVAVGRSFVDRGEALARSLGVSVEIL